MRVALISADDAENDASVTAQSHIGILDAAASLGLEYERTTTANAGGAIESLTSESFDVIVVVGEGFAAATRRAAGEFPHVVFVAVDQSGSSPLPPNLVLLGGDASRQDQLGFVAGVLAGLATEVRKVGSIVPAGSVTGRKYETGFVHGVRLTCGDCDFWNLELDDYSDPTKGRDAARRLQQVEVDAVFAAPGAAGDAALQAAAASGMGAVGVGRDYYVALFGSGSRPGAEHVLPSPFLRADVMLAAVLEDLADRVIPESPIPFSYGNGTLDLALTATDGLSPADLNIAQDIVARLSSGALGTGVDPLTGEVR